MRPKGSITVFLSLTLTVILALSGACLEYARVQVLSYQTQAAAASAGESVFAGYCAPLFERYQLLARLLPDGDTEQLAKTAEVYAKAYGNPGEDEVNFARFTVSGVQWSNLALATDENGAVFSEMAEEALLASEGEVILSEWLKRLGLTDGETADTLKDNAGREEMKSTDVLADYEKLKEAWEEAEAESEPETEAAQEEQKSDAGEEDGDQGQKFLDLLAAIRKILDHGVLGLVIPEGREISDGSVKSEGLPSSLSSETKSRSVRDGGQASGNSILLREYLLRNLSSFTSAEGDGAVYELEYVIAGKKTDEANLRSVVHRILWIRTGMNLTYLLKCPEKMREVKEAAVLAVGWTGQPLLIQGVRGLLLSAWAFAEGVCDVRTLLAGGKEPLIKDDDNWKLTLENLAGEAENFAAEDDGKEEGMSYEDYLRVCLYFTGDSSAAFRGMDVIQWNMQELGETNFRFADCAVSAELTLNVQAEPVFSFLAGGLAKTAGPYTITKKSSFGLLER